MILSDNIVLSDNSILAEDLDAVITNTIIYGSLSEEFLISSSDEADFSLAMFNSVVRTENDALNVNGNLINVDPKFKSPEEYDYSLQDDSPAINNGQNLSIPTDLEGNDRDETPDIGAFENTDD